MVKITHNKSEKLGRQLSAYFSTIKNLNTHQSKTLSIESFNWAPPAISTLLTCYILENEIEMVDFPDNKYLEIMKFGKGVDLIDFQPEHYKTKSYLPIIKISTDFSIDGIRDKMLSKVLETVVSICRLTYSHKQSLSYIFSEFCDNLIDHSLSDFGYISFQNYSSKNYLDLCICDAGQGFLNSYKNYNGSKVYNHIKSDIDAIEAVLDGRSTKHLNERGFGVRTSINLIVKGLGGSVIVGSGSAISPNNDKTISLKDLDWHHKGAYVIIRIPTKPLDGDFSFYDYVE